LPVLDAGSQYDFSSRLGVRAEYAINTINKADPGFGDFQIFMVSGVIAF
jgi:hypothetical protein